MSDDDVPLVPYVDDVPTNILDYLVDPTETSAEPAKQIQYRGSAKRLKNMTQWDDRVV